MGHIFLWELAIVNNNNNDIKGQLPLMIVCIINIPGAHFHINKDVGDEGIGPLHALAALRKGVISLTANMTTFMPAPVIWNHLPPPPQTLSTTRLQLISLVLEDTTSVKTVLDWPQDSMNHAHLG